MMVRLTGIAANVNQVTVAMVVLERLLQLEMTPGCGGRRIRTAGVGTRVAEGEIARQLVILVVLAMRMIPAVGLVALVILVTGAHRTAAVGLPEVLRMALAWLMVWPMVRVSARFFRDELVWLPLAVFSDGSTRRPERTPGGRVWITPALVRLLDFLGLIIRILMDIPATRGLATDILR